MGLGHLAEIIQIRVGAAPAPTLSRENRTTSSPNVKKVSQIKLPT